MNVRTVAGIALIAAALPACDVTARTTTPSSTQIPAPDYRDVQLRSYLRSRFTLDVPPGCEMDGGQGSTDYALFTVRCAGNEVLTIYVGDWAIDTPDQEQGFGEQFGGRITNDQERERLIASTGDGGIRAILTAMPGTRAYIARSNANAGRPFDLEEALRPPPSPRYLLVEIPESLAAPDRTAADSIALSVRPVARLDEPKSQSLR